MIRTYLASLVSRQTLPADALAGVLGAVLSLPQSIAFATLAGLPPQYGIYTAIVPCIIAALFGSSRHVVSGPTNANSLALLAALAPLAAPGSPAFIALCLAVTGLVGVMQLTLGLFRLGWVTDFIAPSVLTGFMSGAAILIGLYALPDALGLVLSERHGVAGTISTIAHGIGATNPSAFAISTLTLIVTLVARRISGKLPFMLTGILAGYGASELLRFMPGMPDVARVGALPSVLPPLSLPVTPIERLPELVSIAGALSIVALGQSISIAKALARRSGDHIDVDREFIGQGLSNVVGCFFSSYVSCGSLNRSLPNYLAGARTPMAAMLSAVFLVILVFATRSVLERLPMPAIAALLVYIACGLIDLRRLQRLMSVSRADFVVALITLVGILVLPFQDAILIGSGLSLAAYLRRTARPAVRTLLPDPRSPSHVFVPIEELPGAPAECPQLKLVRIEGSIYFGAAGHVTRRLQEFRSGTGQKHLLAMVKSMNFVDLAGAEVLDHELTQRRAAGGDLYFHRPRGSVRDIWRRIGFDERLGAANVFKSKNTALSTIYRHLDQEICATCQVRLFRECTQARRPEGDRPAPASSL